MCGIVKGVKKASLHEEGFIMKKISLLDCTLRDGSYITGSHFGAPAMKGIIKKMQDAKVDIIECGWLKDKAYEADTTFYHVPADMESYVLNRSKECTYVVMIDWDRYDISRLPIYDGKSIDAIRVVFPHGKHQEGIAVGASIKAKGYEVFYQAANTMAYADEELIELAKCVNAAHPIALSVVDTFGAMYPDDLARIVGILDRHLDKDIRLGFHSHNNRQLSFALTMYFVTLLKNSERGVIVDASLCGMGRGAGNATTELVAGYLNDKQHGNYDMDAIMDAIDIYMQGFQEKYDWGYSTPYLIAGMYQCHVNNIAYLQKNHRANAHDMRNVIASLSEEERRHYDYDLLEKKYLENQNRIVDDEVTVGLLKEKLSGRRVLLVAPGKSSIDAEKRILALIAKENPVVIGVNAILPGYKYDYVFFTNRVRYDYAAEAYRDMFQQVKKILLSNIKTKAAKDDYIVNFNRAIKRGWPHFDNAVICCLRLLDKLSVADVMISGFDGFKTKYNESYADTSLPTLNPDNDWDGLNREIKDIFKDFQNATRDTMHIEFVTKSTFEQ